MDRDACLLPGYLLVNELQKAYPDCPHWRLSALFSDYVESFRACAQMVSIIGQNEMRPVVEHSGCPEHLVNPWKLDPLTLRFNLKGIIAFTSSNCNYYKFDTYLLIFPQVRCLMLQNY